MDSRLPSLLVPARAGRGSLAASAAAVALVVAAVVALALPTSARAEVDYRIVGGGYGHGIGLSQYGAQGFALAGSYWPSILRWYYTGAQVRKLEGAEYDPLMRVRLQGTMKFSNFWMGGGGRVWIPGAEDVTIPSGVYVRFRRAGSGKYLRVEKVFTNGNSQVVIRWTRRAVYLSGPFTKTQTRFRANNGHSNRHYRGFYSVRLEEPSWADSGYLTVVNHVRMEQYLLGVVPCEVPTSWHHQALRAQAVAARSYAWTDKQSPRASFYDVNPDTSDQMYCGWEEEEAPTTRAVRGTENFFVTHPENGDRPIQAFFFSTSGGRTAWPKDVWGANATNHPWLASRPDPHEWRAGSPHHRFIKRYQPNELASALRVDVGTLRNAASARNSSRRVAWVTAVGSDRRVRISGERARDVLGLKTTHFRIDRLVLWPSTRSTTAGRYVRLAGAIPRGGSTLLCRRPASGGSWRCPLDLKDHVDDRSIFRVWTRVTQDTQFALRRSGITAPVVTVRAS